MQYISLRTLKLSQGLVMLTRMLQKCSSAFSGASVSRRPFGVHAVGMLSDEGETESIAPFPSVTVVTLRPGCSFRVCKQHESPAPEFEHARSV